MAWSCVVAIQERGLILFYEHLFNNLQWAMDCKTSKVRTMKTLLSFGLFLAIAVPVQPATLLSLSLDDMIQRSMAIVQGTVLQSYTATNGSVMYTHYRINVSETWKGPVQNQIDVAVPGGYLNGIREAYSGAPSLMSGHQYVMYLWTSKTGLTVILGLSQGLFDLSSDGQGRILATRRASTERMLNTLGKEMTDSNFKMPVGDMRIRVLSALGSRYER